MELRSAIRKTLSTGKDLFLLCQHGHRQEATSQSKVSITRRAVRVELEERDLLGMLHHVVVFRHVSFGSNGLVVIGDGSLVKTWC